MRLLILITGLALLSSCKQYDSNKLVKAPSSENAVIQIDDKYGIRRVLEIRSIRYTDGHDYLIMTEGGGDGKTASLCHSGSCTVCKIIR